MDIEKALTILADKHGRYLWREDKKGWSFTWGTNSRNIDVVPSLEEAILSELVRLEEDLSGIKQDLRKNTELLDEKEAELKEFRNALK